MVHGVSHYQCLSSYGFHVTNCSCLGRKKKSGEGLGTLLHHGPEMMDSVSTYKPSPHYVLTASPPFPVRDVAMFPGLLLIFLHGSWNINVSEPSSIWCQLSNGTNYQTVEYRKISCEFLSSFTWMCSKCTAFNFWSMCCAVSKTVLRHLITDFLYKTMVYISDIVKERHWLELLFINQQRKSSSFGRSSRSQKHPTICVSVCGGSPSCQVCNILVSSLLFKTLVVKQFQWLYGMPFLRKSYLYSSNWALVKC